MGFYRSVAIVIARFTEQLQRDLYSPCALEQRSAIRCSCRSPTRAVNGPKHGAHFDPIFRGGVRTIVPYSFVLETTGNVFIYVLKYKAGVICRVGLASRFPSDISGSKSFGGRKVL